MAGSNSAWALRGNSRRSSWRSGSTPPNAAARRRGTEVAARRGSGQQARLVRRPLRHGAGALELQPGPVHAEAPPVWVSGRPGAVRRAPLFTETMSGSRSSVADDFFFFFLAGAWWTSGEKPQRSMPAVDPSTVRGALRCPGCGGRGRCGRAAGIRCTAPAMCTSRTSPGSRTATCSAVRPRMSSARRPELQQRRRLADLRAVNTSVDVHPTLRRMSCPTCGDNSCTDDVQSTCPTEHMADPGNRGQVCSLRCTEGRRHAGARRLPGSPGPVVSSCQRPGRQPGRAAGGVRAGADALLSGVTAFPIRAPARTLVESPTCPSFDGDPVDRLIIAQAQLLKGPVA